MQDKARPKHLPKHRLANSLIALSALGTLEGCYDDLLVHLDGLDATTPEVEFRLQAGERFCTSIQAVKGRSSFLVPLRCDGTDLHGVQAAHLDVKTLDESSCAVSSAEADVELMRLGFWPDEITVSPRPLATHRCSLSVTVQGSGRVLSTPPGIDCSAGRCSAEFEAGTAVMLRGNPRYQVRWQLGEGITGELPLLMNQRRSVSAQFTPGPCSEDGFCLYNPLSQGTTLRAMVSIPRQGAWIVGDGGTILFFDGRSLSAVASGTEQDLYGVAASGDGSVVWAVGANGTIQTFNGTAWVRLIQPAQNSVLLRAAWISADGLHAWVVGDSGVVLHYEVTDPQQLRIGPPAPPTLLKPAQLPESSLHAVWGQGHEDVWIAGENKALLHHEGGWLVAQSYPNGSRSLRGLWGQGSSVVVSGDNGGILRRSGSDFVPELSRTSYDLNAVFGTSPNDLWAAGQFGTIVRLQGAGWNVQSLPNTPDLLAGALIDLEDGPQNPVLAAGVGGTLRLYSQQRWTTLDAINSLRDVWASRRAEEAWAVGNSVILHSVRGVTSLASSPNVGWLNGIWGSDDKNIWAVGNSGVILHSSDGESFAGQPSPTGQDLRAICGNSASDVWAVGSGGSALHYDGAEWTLRDAHTSEALNGLWCGAEREVWLVGDRGTILQYDGNGFQHVLKQTDLHLFGVWGDGKGSIYAVGQEGARLHRSSEGTWSLKTRPGIDLYRVSGSADASRVLAVGTGGMLLSLQGESITAMGSGRPETLHSIFWNRLADSAWLVGDSGLLLHYKPTTSAK